MPQSMDIGWLNGWNIHLYAVYKRLVDQKKHADWKWKDGKRKYMQMKGGEKEREKRWAVLVSDKIDFKDSNKRQRKGHYIMIKVTIQQEDIIIVNTYFTPIIGTPKYIKQILTEKKGPINSNTVIRGDFNTLLKSMDRLSTLKKKIIKETVVLNNTLNQMDLTGINRTFHP